MVMPGNGGEMKSDINITPLVDVMLVLLIIFMITAPMLSTGIDLDLPEGTVEQDEQDDESKLVLSIDAKGQVHLGETHVPWGELRTKLETNERIQNEQALYIEADQSLPYGVVIAAMDTAQSVGVSKLMMKTNPVNDTRRRELLEGFEGEGAPEPSGGGDPDG